MKLITKALEKKAPALYATEDTPTEEKKVVAKFFTPWAAWTWYMVEYDASERLAFGFVTSNLCPEGELGYFSLDELESIKGPFGLKIERDLHYGNHTLAEVMDGNPVAK
jgi:hypothetical protein